MEQESKLTAGMWFNLPHRNAPDFVKGSLSIIPDKFIEWLKAQEKSEKGYVRISLKESKSGKGYSELDTWKPSGGDGNIPVANQGSDNEDLPF
jgi:hypothetical protein